MSELGLKDVFNFYIECLLKLFNFMREVPIYENISLFDCLIAMCLFSIFIGIVKTMIKTHNLIRWSDNVATYYNKENEYGFKNFGKPRKRR